MSLDKIYDKTLSHFLIHVANPPSPKQLWVLFLYTENILLFILTVTQN